jgi:hypothetical protein
MPGLAEQVRSFKAKAMGNADAIVRETVLEFSDSLVTDWSPLGDPTLWKAPPPADYRPGNFRSSWFLSIGEPSSERTEATNHQAMNGLDRLPDHPAGTRIYLANSADHAGALEAGHSSQAPVGIMWSAQEFAPMAYMIVRRLA